MTNLLAAYLRPSKIDASKHSRALLKLLVRRLREAWPEVKITIRADSGFCRWRADEVVRFQRSRLRAGSGSQPCLGASGR